MSHLRRVVALIVLALIGWLMAFVVVGAVSATAEAASDHGVVQGLTVCC
jgi:hypothetical protein